MNVEFLDAAAIDDSRIAYAVIVCRHGGRWIFCKHRERNTWEVPGGHREPGETPLEAAARELYEETGALRFDLNPVCVYAVTDGSTATYGLLCRAEIETLGPLPKTSEIERICFGDALPAALTYPEIQPPLFDRAMSVWL